VLELLASLDVVATFFVVGARVERHPALVRRILASGHALGSHSHTHAKPWERDGDVLADYAAGRAALERVTGGPVRLFRPPYGWLDARSAWWIRRHAPSAWLWSVDPEDWRADATAAGIVRSADGLGPGDVMLLHDGVEGPPGEVGQHREHTVAALAPIVERARARGLEFVRLPG
jgi:peptidoglycan/xylan/chitin deacetylase (PgdA/CDA1 family)